MVGKQVGGWKMIQEMCSGFSSVSFSNLKIRKKKNGHGRYFPLGFPIRKAGVFSGVFS